MKLPVIISRIERHVKRANELMDRDLSDDVIFSALSMECFQAINSAIDLGEYLVSEYNLGIPSTYREIFEILHKNKIISDEILSGMKKLIFYRNLIAHEYYTIEAKDLKEIVSMLNILLDLVESVKRYQSLK